MTEQWLNVIGDIGLQLIPSVLMGLLVIVPAMRLLKRVGLSRAWALLSFFPPWLGLVVMVWVIAFSSWKPSNA
jgi:hypothetical protein